MEAQLRATCQFQKANGEYCKKQVAHGEVRCHWHASGLKAKIRSLERSHRVGFWLALAAFLVTLGFGILGVIWHYRVENTPTSIIQSETKVKGNNDVAGNSVTGSGNIVGNNNNVTTPAPVIVAPGSIGITGGTVTNPTVNNFGTTEWHLSDSQKTALGVFADSLPDQAAQYVVVGDIPDRQSQTYATDLFNVLAAHHRVNRRGHILSMAGEFPKGVSIAVHDTGDTNFGMAQRIVSEMRSEDIPVGDVSTSDQIRNHEIHIIVGLMPTTTP